MKIMNNMDININEINLRQQQVLAKDISRKLRFNKKEVNKILRDLA